MLRAPVDAARVFDAPATVRSGLLPILRERVEGITDPRVLDLGPPNSGLLECLRDCRCRVYYNTLPGALPARLQQGQLDAADIDTVLSSFWSGLDSGLSFDVVLAWDYLDYLAPECLQQLIKSIAARCRPGAWFYCQTHQGVAMPKRPARFFIETPQKNSVQLATEPVVTVQASKRLPGKVLLGWMSGFSIHKLYLMQDAKQEHLFCYDAGSRNGGA